MKKAGVITFHRANSYGAFLQAYATVEFLKSCGYDVEIIDYTNAYEQRWNKVIYAENGKIKEYVTSFIKNIILGKRKNYKRVFGAPEKYYNLSQKCTKDDLHNLSYDLLVSGSDQIWNPNITNGIDDAYLLNFGNAKVKISIASSMGSVFLNDEEKNVFTEAFKSFDAISIREQKGKDQIAPLTDKPVKVLMDPTFLFEGNFWRENLSRKSSLDLEKPYILTFFVEPQETYRRKVDDYAQKMKLPVWSIQSIAIKRVNSEKIFTTASIEDFIALIDKAALVITDSFHGVALSLNLHKNFVAFKNVINPVRVEYLLQQLNIEDRIEMKASDYFPVNYASVDEQLGLMQQDSQKWVREAIIM